MAPETRSSSRPCPPLTGTAEPGLTVLIYANTTKLGEATADVVTGVWTDTTGSTVAAGVQRLSVKATDAAPTSARHQHGGLHHRPQCARLRWQSLRANSRSAARHRQHHGDHGGSRGQNHRHLPARWGDSSHQPDLATVTTITLAEGQSLAAGVGNAVASKTFTGAGSVNMTGTAEADT